MSTIRSRKASCEALEHRQLLTKLVDFDADGDLDAYYRSSWYENTNGSGDFIRHELSTENADFSIAADIDGDGDADIITSEPKWYENQNGVFSNIHNIPFENPVEEIRVSDVGGDNDLDVLFFSSSSVSLMENTDGQGSLAFSAQLEMPNLQDAGDFDQDNDIDLLVYSFEDGDLTLAINQGDGSYHREVLVSNELEFDEILEVRFGTQTTKGQFVDVDGDGDLDVTRHGFDFDTHYANNFLSWFPNSDGTFNDEQRISGGCGFSLGGTFGAIRLIDWDYDGDQDIWCHFGDFENEIRLTERLNDGSFGNNRSLTPLGHPEFPLIQLTDVGDLNHDGVVDFVSRQFESDIPKWMDGVTLTIYSPPRPSVFSDEPLSFGNDIPHHDVKLVDLTGDSKLNSVIVAENQVKVWNLDLSQENHFTELQQIDIAGAKAIETGDLDGDGDIDVIVATQTANQILINNGTGSLEDNGQMLGSGSSSDVAIGDLDADRDLDLIFSNSDGPSRIWFNNGAGQFSDSKAGLGAQVSNSVAIADLDDDGDLDAILATPSGEFGKNQVWMNNGDGVFSLMNEHRLFAKQTNHIVLADLDKNQTIDYFFATPVVENLSNRVYLDKYAFQLLPLEDSAQAAIGDVNNDGHFDVVVANTSLQSNSVWLNDGNGVLEGTLDTLGAANSNSVALGDVDGDGDLDAVFANDGVNSLFLNRTDPNEPNEFNLLPPFPVPRVDDHGNTNQEATVIDRPTQGVPTTFSGRVDFDNDVDVFEMMVSFWDHYKIDVTRGDAQFKVFDSRGLWLRGPHLFKPDTNDSKFFIAVEGSIGEYELEVSKVTDDHAENRNQGTQITIPSSTAGELIASDDDDWFRFDPVQGETYWITIDHDTLQEPEVDLYVQAGAPLASLRAGRIKYTVDNPSLRTLFIRVTGDDCRNSTCESRVRGTYTLIVDTKEPGNNDPIPGDSNHDGVFNSTDFVFVFQKGEYEDNIMGNSTFESGDWNNDGDFNSGDFVFVFQAGTYVADARAVDIAAAVDLIFEQDRVRLVVGPPPKLL